MLKAIQTRYKGHYFRSRLEARWAVFFDAIGIKWEYEKEGFELGRAGRYLPDFWLPSWKAWVEIKPERPSDEERAKARALADHHRPVIMLIGSPGDERPILFAHSSSNSGAGCFESDMGGTPRYQACRLIYYGNGILGLWVDTDDSIFDAEYESLPFVIESAGVEYDPTFSLVALVRALRPAYDAARSARFEFGGR